MPETEIAWTLTFAPTAVRGPWTPATLYFLWKTVEFLMPEAEFSSTLTFAPTAVDPKEGREYYLVTEMFSAIASSYCMQCATCGFEPKVVVTFSFRPVHTEYNLKRNVFKGT